MIGAALALGTGMVSVPAVLFVLRRFEVLDVPNERSSHAVAVVRGGGLGVAVALVVGLLAVDGIDSTGGAWGVPAVAFGFGLIGFVEDVRPDRPVLVRFGAQVIFAALGCLLLLEGVHLPIPLWALAATGTLVAIVGFANVYNFMDGINGISAVTAMVAGATFAIVGIIEDVEWFAGVGGVLAAATLAFLPFNFPRARLFLGDVGSYMLGALIAALVVVGLRAGLSPTVLAAPLVPHVADASATLAWRVLGGSTWWQPHREHLYQRLVDAGWSPVRVTALFAAGAIASAVCVGGTQALQGERMASVGLLLVAGTYTLVAWHWRRDPGKT